MDPFSMLFDKSLQINLKKLVRSPDKRRETELTSEESIHGCHILRKIRRRYRSCELIPAKIPVATEKHKQIHKMGIENPCVETDPNLQVFETTYPAKIRKSPFQTTVSKTPASGKKTE